jgi:hypothetical protein
MSVQEEILEVLDALRHERRLTTSVAEVLAARAP